MPMPPAAAPPSRPRREREEVMNAPSGNEMDSWCVIASHWSLDNRWCISG